MKSTFASILFSLVSILLGYSSLVQAANNALSNVNVVDIPKGYEMEIHHEKPLKYAGHSPKGGGDELEIRLNQSLPISFDKDSDILNWASAFGVPVKKVRIEDLMTTTPTMYVEFTKAVKFDVKNTRDNRTTIISIETDRPEFTGPMPSREDGVTNLVIALKPLDPEMDVLLDRASDHMLDEEYRQAVQVFIRIRERGNDDIQGPIQELIGLTREYLGQNAQAIAEYESYMERFPEGEAAGRVQQRLNALKTAALRPKEKRKSAKAPGKESEWDKQVYGSLAQTYYYDEFNTPSQEKRVLRSALNNHVHVSGRASNDTYDLRARFSGTYQKDFEFDGDRDITNPNMVTIEGRHKDLGLFARLGRQSRSSGGVLGRFDGAHVAYEYSPQITINGVFGYQMDYLRKDAINTDQPFYGASVDVGDIWEGWEFSGFIIQQDYMDFVDRRAIGGEARYFDAQKNFFSLVDYDVEVEQLNIFMANGRWEFSDQTSVNATYSFRANPILLSSGAIQALGVNYVEFIEDRLTREQLQERIASSVADYTTATLGVSHELNPSWTLDGEIYASQYGGAREFYAVTNDGQIIDIAEIPKTDWEFYYTARATTDKLFLKDDSTTFHLRFSDTDRHTTTSFGMNWRYNITPELRINPKIRFDSRSSNINDDSRTYTRWDLALDYKVHRKVKLEFDIGYDWQLEETPLIDFESTGLYMAAGYRWTF